MGENFITEEVNQDNKQITTEGVKPKWYYSCPVLLATCCFCFPVSFILSLVRLIRHKGQKGGYRIRSFIAVGINLVLILITCLSIGSSMKWEKDYAKYIESGNYDQAKEMLDERYKNFMSAQGVEQYLKIFDLSDNYDDFGRVVVSYQNSLEDITEFNEEIMRKIKAIDDKLSPEQKDIVEVVLEDIKEAQKKKEESRAAAESESQSIEESKAMAKSETEKSRAAAESESQSIEESKAMAKSEAEKSKAAAESESQSIEESKAMAKNEAEKSKAAAESESQSIEESKAMAKSEAENTLEKETQGTISAESKDEFIASCKNIPYKSLARNPDDYIGTRIVLDVKVQQIVKGVLFDDNEYYRVYTNDDYDMWMGDEYFMYDCRVGDKTKILADDIWRVYAVFDGMETVTRALTHTKEDVPCIKVIYADLMDELELSQWNGTAMNNMKSDTNADTGLEYYGNAKADSFYEEDTGNALSGTYTRSDGLVSFDWSYTDLVNGRGTVTFYPGPLASSDIQLDIRTTFGPCDDFQFAAYKANTDVNVNGVDREVGMFFIVAYEIYERDGSHVLCVEETPEVIIGLDGDYYLN